MEIFKIIWDNNPPAMFATICLALYFLGMAVVFISRMEGAKQVNDGYCITCAKEMGIAPVDDLLNKMGISSEELENLEEMTESFALEAAENGFEPGGAQTFPFLNSIMGGDKKGTEKGKKDKEKGEKER